VIRQESWKISTSMQRRNDTFTLVFGYRYESWKVPLCAVCRSVLLRRLRLTHFNTFQWWEKRPEIAPFVEDPGPNLAHGSLGPPSSTTLDGLSIGSAVYVELTVVSNRQTHTDHATTVARGRIAFLTDNAYSRPIQEISNQKRWQSPGGQTRLFAFHNDSPGGGVITHTHDNAIPSVLCQLAGAKFHTSTLHNLSLDQFWRRFKYRRNSIYKFWFSCYCSVKLQMREKRV